MRIIGGEKKGMKLADFKTKDIRPTPDRVREAIFNILHSRVDGMRVLCPFAGSGAMGLEALSRGASAAVFVDNGRVAQQVLHKNIATLGYEDCTEVIRTDVFRAHGVLSSMAPFDLVVVDPPYRMTRTVEPGDRIHDYLVGLAEAPYLKPGGLVLLDHPKKAHLDCSWDPLVEVDHRRYGSVCMLFLKKPEAPTEPTGDHRSGVREIT